MNQRTYLFVCLQLISCISHIIRHLSPFDCLLVLFIRHLSPFDWLLLLFVYYYYLFIVYLLFRDYIKFFILKYRN